MTTVAPVEQIPLSFHQEFLCAFDTGTTEGPFGPRYHVVGAWRLRGELDLTALEAALGDVVARHEALRTVIVRDGERPYQRVLAPCSPRLTVRDLGGCPADERESRAEELLNEVESGTNDACEVPLLRAVVGRFDDTDAVLVLNAHHTAADAWSIDVILRDLLACHAARAEGTEPDLPDVPQYQEYARHERENADSPAAVAARAYWRDTLRDARITALRSDRPRSAGAPKATSWHRFAVDTEVASAAVSLAGELKSSPFMVLFAAYQVFLSRLTGTDDLVVPTFTPGRGNARFHETVGSFINFLPLRTDLSGCGTFRDVVRRTRQACLGAYSHDVPFVQILGEAPTLMAPVASDDLQVSAFQAISSPYLATDERAGGLTYSKLWRRTVSQEVGSDVPDGILWTLHIGPSNDMVGSLGFNSNRFDADTMSRMLADFLRVLRAAVTAPDTDPRRL
ncbi:condensation domain-containing protein [Streptosporangium longisporum]|uniref:Condensation domain-containing protein n=1 Tax=Streptosporangium longisporum TaxID=46187 RepID=A0ABP6LGE6_9ACTN